MEKFTSKASFKQKNRRTALMALALAFFSLAANSQVRNYSLVYSENVKGGTTLFGNTLMHILDSKGNVDTKSMNSLTAGNDGSNMQFVNIDGTNLYGKVIKNSSSADLILPANSTVKFARLYWGGIVQNSEYDLTKDANKKIKIRKGGSGNYADVTAGGIDQFAVSTGKNGYTEYQAYADVTSYVKQNGAGTYSVGSVPLSVGSSVTYGAHGGWSIVVVYENSSVNYNSVRVYDGFQQVYNGGNSTATTVTLTGLNVPSGTLAAGDAKMGVVAWEGDANLSGDYLKINDNLFSNSTNPKDNPFNGSITDNGVQVTTKSPNYVNQMGLDIDMFNVGQGYGILPNATSVKLEFGTKADQYYPGVFTFSIKMKDPTITLTKTVMDANNNHQAEIGEVLTYTLKGKNSGVGDANEIVIADTLPSSVTYVPNSLKVINAPGAAAGFKPTDKSGDDIAEVITNGKLQTVIFRIGTGATATKGGTLAENESYEVQFQVKVNQPGNGLPVPPIVNIARIKSISDADESFTDEGTAILNPEAGPMPVTLTKFTASLMQNNRVLLDWGTSMEINCKEFIVERSFDGNSFSQVAVVGGNGTTSLFHSYSTVDDLPSSMGTAAYYRLKQMDLDGKSHLSKVVSVKLKKDNNVSSVSPNPFTSYLNVTMEWSKTEIITVKVINVQGKDVLTKSVQVNKGSNYIKLDDLSRLPSGNYFIQFISATERLTQKVTK